MTKKFDGLNQTFNTGAEIISKKIDNDNLLPMFNRHTRVMARDGLHPGPEAHLQFSDVIVKRIK